MEAKFLAGILSFLSIFLAIYAQSSANDVEDSTAFEFDTAIYYGDSVVNLGERFSITCIIPITDRIFWLKDDEPITRHNLRHGRDEHSYVLSESAIEGEKHKIEAHLSVRHALKVHEGKYQCNDQHSSYHMLRVRSPTIVAQKPMTISPFLLHPIGGGDDVDDIDMSSRQHYSTEAGYATIQDMTSSQTNDDDLFTRTWEPIDPETPPQILALPTKKPITTTTIIGQQPQQQQQQHHGSHHHHTHDHSPPHVQQMEHDMKHKLFYINTTNFDGNPLASEGRHHNRTKIGLVNLDLNPPPTPPPYYTTDSRRMPSIYYATTPPSFPPPRTTPAMIIPHHTPPPAVQHYPHNVQMAQHPQGYPPYKTHEGYHMATPGAGAGVQQQSQYPIQTMQPPAPPFYSQYPPTQQQQQYNTMVSFPTHTGGGVHTTTTLYQNPFQQYNQMPAPPQYNVPNTSGSIVATSAPIFASSSGQGLQPPPPPVITTGMGYGTVGVGGMTSTISSGSTLSKQDLTKAKGAELLVPNYDNPERQLKVYEIRSPLILSCDITDPSVTDLTWEKNGTDVRKVKELEGRFRIIAAERKFIIDKTEVNDDGLYSCVANNQKKDINVVANVVVRVPSNSGVVEGEKLTIICTVVGTDPKLSWAFRNLTISSTFERYILKADENNVENAILVIENASLDDRGEYKCIGRNAATDIGKTEASDVSFVRVKGKYAALWPFLGICVEVLILCTIILIYEKRRNKSELDESDTDNQELDLLQ
ncbi:immunoglobulin domain-containing protein Bsg isoform 2-T12 [Cochliomyia hominivorax]